MKYCGNYFDKNKKLKELDEINITLNNAGDFNFDTFIAEFLPKRINLCVFDVGDFIDNNLLEFTKSLIEKYKEVSFHLRFEFSKEDEYVYHITDKCNENKIPFYYSNRVNDWDTLIGYITAGVSDVYITDDLGFELDQVSAIVHAAAAQVRVYPNIAQSKYYKTKGIKKFFIRPEDVHTYEKYVDVMEFFCGIDKFNVLYEIYKEQKAWLGDLSELILELDTPIDSRCIVSYFSERRVKCRKNCMRGRGCNLCDSIVELAQTLSKNDIIVNQVENF